MYEQGRVTGQPDYREAEKWYRQGAQGGNAVAMNNLGTLYDKGLGRPRNPLVAYRLFEMSARSDVSADNKAPENRQIVRQQLSPAQLQEAQRLLADIGTGAQLLERIDALLGRPAGK